MSAPTKTALELELGKNFAILDKLVLHCTRQLRNPTDGEDAASGTLERVLRRERRGDCWTPPGPPSAFDYLKHHSAGILKEFRERYTQAKRRNAGVEDAENVAGGGPTAEQMLIDAELLARVRRAIAKETRGNIRLQMLDLAAEGVKGHDAMADRIGVSLGAIREAQRRLNALLRELLAAEGDA